MSCRHYAMQSNRCFIYCYDYSNDNDILFNPIKLVCNIFKPKAYQLYLPSVPIGSVALKYVAESKYLGDCFCESNQDDNDILRQIKTVYVKSNTVLRTFSHCLTDVKVTLFQSYYTALYCPFLWSDYMKSTFRKFRVAFNNAFRKIFGNNAHVTVNNHVMYAYDIYLMAPSLQLCRQ